MKRCLILGAVLGISGPAMAADLGPFTKAPLSPSVPTYSWTGCYLGAQAGSAWQHTGFSDPTGAVFAAPGTAIATDGHEGLLGGQIGCDRQMSAFVVGLEADWSWVDLTSTGAGNVADPMFSGKNHNGIAALSSKTRSVGSVTGRVGYAFDRWLVYAKGGAGFSLNSYGAAFSAFNSQVFTTPGANYVASEWRVGWTLGAGVEWALADHWSTKLEYDHYDFGSRTLTLADTLSGGTTPATVKQTLDVVKVGLNYRFHLTP